MKTFALRQFVKIKAVFASDGITPGKMEKLSIVNEAATTPAAQQKTVNIQRKAYTGNFFAGPHCVFDPRLF